MFKFVFSELCIVRESHCWRSRQRIMLIYKQLSRSVNYSSQSCQQSSIQPIRSWYQELVSWNGGINGMSTGSHAHSLLTRPLSVRPVRPRLHSAISNGSLFAGYYITHTAIGVMRAQAWLSHSLTDQPQPLYTSENFLYFIRVMSLPPTERNNTTLPKIASKRNKPSGTLSQIQLICG